MWMCPCEVRESDGFKNLFRFFASFLREIEMIHSNGWEQVMRMEMQL